MIAFDISANVQTITKTDTQSARRSAARLNIKLRKENLAIHNAGFLREDLVGDFRTVFDKFSKLKTTRTYSKTLKKPPRDCKISFDQNCVPENVFYVVKDGSNILANTTCPTDNFISKKDIKDEHKNSISSSKSINQKKSLPIMLIFVITRDLF